MCFNDALRWDTSCKVGTKRMGLGMKIAECSIMRSELVKHELLGQPGQAALARLTTGVYSPVVSRNLTAEL